MKTKLFHILAPSVALTIAAVSMPVVAASAAPQRHHSRIHYAGAARASGAYQPLVSDGPGTGFGFHRLPLPYHVASVRERDRQSNAVHRAVVDDALTSGNYHSGFLGDSVYGAGNGAAYGVFNGADGYGSPYFAGYYGPGDGADYGPFGHAYTN